MYNVTNVIIALTLIISSCNQNPSNEENSYIKNLEEKNKILEKELQEEKNKPPIIIEKPIENKAIPKEPLTETITRKDYFTIGSTEYEVIEVMGDPTSINDFSTIGVKRFSYGLSTVSFKNGYVDGYNNFEKNLKVKMKR